MKYAASTNHSYYIHDISINKSKKKKILRKKLVSINYMYNFSRLEIVENMIMLF